MVSYCYTESLNPEYTIFSKHTLFSLILRNSPELYHGGGVGQVCHHDDLHLLRTALGCEHWTGEAFQFSCNNAIFLDWIFEVLTVTLKSLT